VQAGVPMARGSLCVPPHPEETGLPPATDQYSAVPAKYEDRKETRIEGKPLGLCRRWPNYGLWGAFSRTAPWLYEKSAVVCGVLFSGPGDRKRAGIPDLDNAGY